MIKLARPRGGVGGSFVEKRLSTKKRVIESIINCTTPQRSMRIREIVVFILLSSLLLFVIKVHKGLLPPYIYICFLLLIVIVIGWFLYYCRFVRVSLLLLLYYELWLLILLLYYRAHISVLDYSTWIGHITAIYLLF